MKKLSRDERRRAALSEATYLLANVGCASAELQNKAVELASAFDRWLEHGARQKPNIVALKSVSDRKRA